MEILHFSRFARLRDFKIIRDREKLFFLKKVPNNLNNISQFMIYHDKMTLKPSKVEKIINFAPFYVPKFLKNMLKMLSFFKLQYLKIPKLENFGS